jgi:tetratricopeptide (TPR) repeat protein
VKERKQSIQPNPGVSTVNRDKARQGLKRLAVLGLVCALVIGVYAWSASSGVIELMGSGAQDSYYNLLVRGFRDGHLSVKREVPPELGDPAKLKWEDNYGLDELSYYKGKLYLYYGVTPAVALFWPYAALTGHYLLHKDATVIFFSAGFLAGAGLLWAVWRRYFKECGSGVLAAGMLALGLAGLAPAVLGRCDVYEVAISCGYALTMLALAGIWRALHDERRRWRWLAAASLAYGLALGARPSLLFGAVILLVPVAQAWREKRRVWPLLLAACGPIVAMGAGLMIYNALRFDNPLEFGQRYQLPLVVHQQFSLRYLWINFRVGFLDPARWGGHFPFVDDIAEPELPKGYWQVDHAFGVLTNIPVVWLALAAPLAWRRGSEEARSNLRWFMGAVALLFGVCVLTLDLHDSMCLRYEMEYAAPLLLLAVVGVFAVERALAGRPAWRWAARCGWGLLLAFSLAFSLLAGSVLKADTHAKIGLVLLKKGSVDEAVANFQKALQMNPDNVLVDNILGNALLQKGRVDEAIAEFQKARQIKPNDPAGHSNLGNALLQKGRVDEAIAEFQQALQIKPGLAVAHYNLGTALLQKGRVDEAIAHFEKALEIQPADPTFQNNLAWLLATAPVASLRNGGKAVELARQASLLTGGENPVVLHTLAAACAEAGRYSEAVETAQQALRLAQRQSNAALAAALEMEIKLYQAGSPFHGPAQ